MGEKPVIGITGGFLKKNDFVQGPYAHQDYVNALLLAGAVPVILPYAEDVADHYLDFCDGIVFSGGSDIDPRFYGEDPSPWIEAFNTERDQSELQILHQAIKRNKPVLGICRGFQLLNIAFGGTLYQDLAAQTKQPLQHDQRAPRSKTVHSIRLLPNSRLSKLFDGRESLFVNSLHHQAVKVLAEDLRAVAFAGDGVIEAAEHKNNERILGIQWHPESMAAAGDTLMLRLFAAFVRRCGSAKAEPIVSTIGSTEKPTELI
ncbi:MAG: gamma-glutamyl-gamma-aminobutyrate hydrolase family protein [Sporolactobacillus sp.]